MVAATGPCCHKCGSAPNTEKSCYALSACKSCGVFTCNQHLVGWTASTCPACGGDTQVVARHKNKIKGSGIKGKDFSGKKKTGGASKSASTAMGQSGFGGGSAGGSSSGGSGGGAGAAPTGFGGGAGAGSFNLGGGGSTVQEAQAPENKSPEKASETELYGSATVEGQVKDSVDGEKVLDPDETNNAEHGMLGTLTNPETVSDSSSTNEESTEAEGKNDSATSTGTTNTNTEKNDTTEVAAMKSSVETDTLKTESIPAVEFEDIGISLDFTSTSGSYSDSGSGSQEDIQKDKNYADVIASETAIIENTEISTQESSIDSEIEDEGAQEDEIQMLSSLDLEKIDDDADEASNETDSEKEIAVAGSNSDENDEESDEMNRPTFKSREEYLANFSAYIDNIEKKEASDKLKKTYIAEGVFLNQRDMDMKSYLNDVATVDYDFSIAYLSGEVASNTVQVMNSLGADNHKNFVSVGIPAKQAGQIVDKLAEEISALEAVLKALPKAVAIGPTGLDLKFAAYTKDKQIELFKAQVALAEAYNLPILIQHVNACEEIIDIVKDINVKMLFCDIVDSEKLVEFIKDKDNAYLLFRSEYTHRSYKEKLDLIEKLPIESVIVGSGEPMLAPATKAGQLNNTKLVGEVFKFAEVFFRKEPDVFTLNNLLNVGEFYSEYKRPEPIDPYAWK